MSLELSPCLEWLFADEAEPFAERIPAAARSGVGAVEFWRWRDKDLDAVEGALQRNGVAVSSFVAEPLGATLVDPGAHAAFLRGLEESAAVAQRFGSPYLVAQPGQALADRPRAEQTAAMVACLREAGRVLVGSGVTLLLEPLNTRVDHPGCFIDDTAVGFAVIRAVDSPRVRLLYDVYHSVVMGEEPERVLAGNLALVAHVQVADVPGRHEPGTGTIEWGRFFAWLEEQGYSGRVGLEYVPMRPSGETLDTLRRLAPGLV